MDSVALKVDEEIVIPKIKPANLEINAEGFCFREWFIRLPQDVTWTAIHENPEETWRLVQSNPHVALRALDRVVFLTHDESEMAMATVCTATNTKVILAGFRKFTFGGRDTTAEWADEMYSVKFDGTGYAIHRRKDNVRMKPGSFSTLELAKSEVRRLYPVKTGAK